jgi:hypothetical protein
MDADLVSSSAPVVAVLCTPPVVAPCVCRPWQLPVRATLRTGRPELGIELCEPMLALELTQFVLALELAIKLCEQPCTLGSTLCANFFSRTNLLKQM